MNHKTKYQISRYCYVRSHYLLRYFRHFCQTIAFSAIYFIFVLFIFSVPLQAEELRNNLHVTEKASDNDQLSGRTTRSSPDVFFFQPFQNSTWEFTYTTTGTFTGTILCVNSFDMDGGTTLIMICSDQYSSTTKISHTMSTGQYLILNTMKKYAYVFTISGCCNAQGSYYATDVDPQMKNPYPLVGKKLREVFFTIFPCKVTVMV